MTAEERAEFERVQAAGVGPLVRGALWCAGVLVIAAAGLYATFWLPYREQSEPPYPHPALPQTPAAEPAQGYGWVDRDAGIVRIPVEDAMRITTERLPVRDRAADEKRPSEPSADAGSGRAPKPDTRR